MHYLEGLGKCWVGAPHSHEALGSIGGIGGWCVVACERENGQCEL